MGVCRIFGGGEMKITKEILIKEMGKFREIMGLKKFTYIQVSDALRGLLFCYVNYTPKNKKDKEK